MDGLMITMTLAYLVVEGLISQQSMPGLTGSGEGGGVTKAHISEMTCTGEVDGVVIATRQVHGGTASVEEAIL